MEISKSRINGGYELVFVGISRGVVCDLERRSRRLGDHPLEFYVAFSGMDSPENCLEFLSDRDASLDGWRLYTGNSRLLNGRRVQIVEGFEPIVIKGEAVAYARPAIRETFRVSSDAVVHSKYGTVPEDLVELLGGLI